MSRDPLIAGLSLILSILSILSDHFVSFENVHEGLVRVLGFRWFEASLYAVYFSPLVLSAIFSLMAVFFSYRFILRNREPSKMRMFSIVIATLATSAILLTVLTQFLL